MKPENIWRIFGAVAAVLMLYSIQSDLSDVWQAAAVIAVLICFGVASIHREIRKALSQLKSD